jgi:hypothetical protein
MASDMFSLGATLAFAATGHAPYRGETVMDVLVRLATEPPDLSGLPAELTGIVTACLARSPRERPTSAALLDQLGPFVTSPAGPGSAHAYLPAAAMAVISGYQHGPRQATSAAANGSTGEETSTGTGEETGGGLSGGAVDNDATFGSQVAVPALAPAGRGSLRPGEEPAGWAEERAVTPTPGAPGPARRPRRRRALVAAGLAGAAAALVAAGILVGSLLTGPGDQTATGTSGGAIPSLPPGPPPSAFPPSSRGSPQIVMLQPIGDPATVFLIHGTGWVPQSHVTVTLAGHGQSPVKPVVDMQGTFNYAVNQGHEWFPRQIPPGVYQIVVTGPGGRRARASFRVNAPPPGPGQGRSSP